MQPKLMPPEEAFHLAAQSAGQIMLYQRARRTFWVRTLLLQIAGFAPVTLRLSGVWPGPPEVWFLVIYYMPLWWVIWRVGREWRDAKLRLHSFSVALLNAAECMEAYFQEQLGHDDADKQT